MEQKFLVTCLTAFLLVADASGMNFRALANERADKDADFAKVTAVKSIAEFVDPENDDRTDRFRPEFFNELLDVNVVSGVKTLTEFIASTHEGEENPIDHTAWLDPDFVKAVKIANIKLNPTTQLPAAMYVGLVGTDAEAVPVPADNTIGTMLMTVLAAPQDAAPAANSDASQALEYLYTTIVTDAQITPNATVDTVANFPSTAEGALAAGEGKYTTNAYMGVFAKMLTLGRAAANDFHNITAAVFPTFQEFIKRMIGAATDAELIYTPAEEEGGE